MLLQIISQFCGWFQSELKSFSVTSLQGIDISHKYSLTTISQRFFLTFTHFEDAALTLYCARPFDSYKRCQVFSSILVCSFKRFWPVKENWSIIFAAKIDQSRFLGSFMSNQRSLVAVIIWGRCEARAPLAKCVQKVTRFLLNLKPYLVTFHD